MDHQEGNNSILKRKRSKLQRPFVGGMLLADGRPNVVTPTTTTTYSSLSSEDQMPLATEEEEEEDREVAKCLILLAQAHYPADGDPRKIGALEMMSSRKWRPLENNKKVNRGGVYECKTCYRSFHSFQALGGHRTSHKKPRITTHDETPLVSKSPHMGVNVPVPTIAALQLGSRTAAKSRVHECAICGAEFASGQALGGHMRRHRVTNSPLETSTTETKAAAADGVSITLSLLTAPAHEEASSRSDHNDLLSLDLNLPAASSSSSEETRSFLPEQLQDSGLGLSTPALVDCQY